MIRKIAQLRLSLADVRAFRAVVNSVLAIRYQRIVGATVLSASALMVSSPVQSTPLIDFSSSVSAPISSPGFTLGYRFKVFESVSVDGIGIFNFLSDGMPDDLSDSHEVALWEASEFGTQVGDTPLVFKTVVPSSTFREDSASRLGEYVYAALEEQFTLDPDTFYVLGASYELTSSLPQDPFVFGAQDIVSENLRAEYIVSQFALNDGNGIVFPNESEGQTDRYFGPALHVAGISIPEPTTLTLLALALASMMFGRRPLRQFSSSMPR